MPIQIHDKKKCSGCSACSNICPRHCISMKNDESGFLYPNVSIKNCSDCGLCVKVCPILNISSQNPFLETKIYAAYSKNKNTRFTSTSGGAFTELALSVLSQKGLIAGAIYDERNLVIHEIFDDENGLEKIKQSKYLQSEIRDVFKRIRGYLNKGKIVLFCGTPCQVSGLKSFLCRDYSNLLTVDFICRGVNSPKAYKCWLKELEIKFSSEVNKIWFKYKKFGWKDSPRCTYIEFENEKKIIIDGINNTYMRGYLDGNLFLRPSCGDCLFKGKNRSSDITLADFWGIDKANDDDKGTSMIIVNSVKGKCLLDSAKNKLFLFEKSFEQAFSSNNCFENSVTINVKSEEFLNSITDNNFSELVNYYVNKNYKTELKRRVRHLLMGVLKFFKRFNVDSD